MLNEKNEIMAGDTLELSLSYEGYSPSDGWLVWIALRGNLKSIDIKASTSGVTVDTSNGCFDITVSPGTTDDYSAGDYQYSVYMYKGSPTVTERHTVESGAVTIKSDLAVLTKDSDARSHVKKVLDAIEAVIENRASLDQMSYEIAGRKLSRMPIDDLLKLRDRYKTEYYREKRADRISQGLATNKQVKVRF